MRLPKFEYLEPKTLRAAGRALSLHPGESVLLAGGTDLLVRMKLRVSRPGWIINLKAVPKLASITEQRDGIRIGALTTLRDLVTSSLILRDTPALATAAGDVGAYGHQAMGTLGGNLCQENRCRFYNQSAFWRSVRPPCFKVGGEVCHVVRKKGECHSAYCGDLAPVLISLGARANLAGPAGERTIGLKRLYTGNGAKPLSLRKGEILKEVFIPKPSGKAIYLKWRLRDSLEYPIVSVAVYLERGQGEIKNTGVVFSGVGPSPVEATEAEKSLKGVSLDDTVIEQVSLQAAKEIAPMRTSIHSPAYKRKMAAILVRQALEAFKLS